MLTTAELVDKVQAYLGLGADEATAVLTDMVNGAKDIITRYLGYKIFEEQDTYTEVYDGESREYLELDHVPLVSVTSLHDDINRLYQADSLIAVGDYVLLLEEGTIRLDGFNFYDGVHNVRVVYVGGYDTLPAGVVQAVVQGVAAWYNKGSMGGDGVVSERLGDHSVTFEHGMAGYPARVFPAGVLSGLGLYRRIAV